MKYFGTIAVCCLEMMGEERGVCVEQSPVLIHRTSLSNSSGGGVGGLEGTEVVSLARMRPSHSSQDVASISHEQDYWEYGPGIVDRLKSKFINLSMNNQVGGQNGAISTHAPGKKNHLRSCASLENLQDGMGPNTTAETGGAFHRVPAASSVSGIGAAMNTTHKLLMISPANMRHHEPRRNPLVPKCPSMEILLDANRHYESHHLNATNNNSNSACDNGPGNQRAGVVSSSMSSVVESELPRRDIVRKYKSFFEQTSTSSSPQHLTNGTLHQSSAASHLSQKGSGGILRNNKTSPIKKPVANIKPLRKEQPPSESEARNSPPLNKLLHNKDNSQTNTCLTVLATSTSNVNGTEAVLNEINRQVNVSAEHSHNTLVSSIADPGINCGSDIRPQTNLTSVSSRQIASAGAQQMQVSWSPAGLVTDTVSEPRTPSLIVKPRACPLLLSESNSRPLAGCNSTTSGSAGSVGNMGSYMVGSLSTNCTSMVFDFRGKDVKPQVAVMPSPARLASKEELDGLDDSSEPSGITFIGENVVVGGGSLISTRNKNLSIRFDEQNLSSFFEYEAEDDDDDDETDEDPLVDDLCGSGEEDASENTARGLPSAVLGNYKPGVLSSGDDDFELGVSRLKRQQQTLAEESIEQQETGGELQAKPASHEETSVYSQVSSSDLLF
ncbi:uncharacterized protein LOC111253544 isoform X2 [Varroa destructor]|uniref:Uncharacterized protein n=1 Tax=Varroa destructor TaxID=109461 RepID=A0A7M7KLV8_VARDE|nr:uncharacterized protein LOC111253544 isoform X2 [Varroa destructor]